MKSMPCSILVLLSTVLHAADLQDVPREEADSHPQLTVMTWNIRYNNPDDGVNAWPHRKDWVAEIVVQNEIDVAGFQEVLHGQFDDLKSRLPNMDSYGVGRDDGKLAGEFCPIFWRKERFELLAKSTFWLSATPEVPGSKGWDAALPRIASWVQLKDRLTGNNSYVLNTHFDHRGEQARTESAALLLKQMRAQFAGQPVILTGDFNTQPETRPYRILTGADEAKAGPVYRDSYQHSLQKPTGPKSTWNGFEAIVPDRRIDFIFTTPSVKVMNVKILEDQRDGRFPSDHLPVLTTLLPDAK